MSCVENSYIYISCIKQIRAGLHPDYSSVLFPSIENGLFKLTGYGPSEEEAKAGTQSRDLEAGTETETMKEHCFPAFLSWLYQPALY